MVEAIVGRATVCAFANARQVLCQSMDGLDQLQRISFAKDTIGSWLGIRMQLIGYTMAMYTTMYPIFQYYGLFSPQSAALVGFSIMYAKDTIAVIQQFINNFSDLEMQLISIERLREYACSGIRDGDASAEERALGHVPHDELVATVAPRLRLVNASVTYHARLQPALEGVTLDFAPREVAAIVGRTGAGKTSLLLAILQMVPYTGLIEVDGCQLSLLAPEDVRRRIVGVVPQQPLLFSGTLRWNLDPDGTCDDAQLWDVLRAVGLHQSCSRDSRGLAVPVVGREGSAGGGSGAIALSQGQQQLLCAARVLLRRQRVVMLDEVSSTLPQETAVTTVLDMVARFKAADATVLLVTHQDEVACICERVITLAEGHIFSDTRTPGVV